ncbi:uncharacterized protein [Prorops nasuta]|uniref:uncharacterized protein n=2 Tax=Prorops nasuta TaxID=863751 RepID=UPI0034CEA455
MFIRCNNNGTIICQKDSAVEKSFTALQSDTGHKIGEPRAIECEAQCKNNDSNIYQRDSSDGTCISIDQMIIAVPGESNTHEYEGQYSQNNLYIHKNNVADLNNVDSNNHKLHNSSAYDLTITECEAVNFKLSGTNTDIWSAFNNTCITNENFSEDLSKQNDSYEQEKSEYHNNFITTDNIISTDGSNAVVPYSSLNASEHSKTNINYSYSIEATNDIRISSIIMEDVNLGSYGNESFEEVSCVPQIDRSNLPENEVWEEESNNTSGSSYKPDTSDSDVSNVNLIGSNESNKSTLAYISKNSSLNTTLNVSNSIKNTSENRVPDDEAMIVSSVESGLKKDFCMYCHTHQTKLSRHLSRKHGDIKEVKEFLLIPKGRRERKMLINIIRKQSQFYYNTNSQANKGELKVMRRPNEKLNKRAVDFAFCPQCKGSYSKSSLRYHFRTCNKKRNKSNRNILTKSRQTAGRIHEVACDVLRQRVFPTLREDTITKTIRYDELCILFGNKLCDKYKDAHFYDMIRQRLRQIGRFLYEIKKRDSDINDLFSVLHPKYYKLCIQTIQTLAGINETGNGFKTPSTATAMGTLLKQISKRAITVYILRDDKEKLELVEKFLKLITEDYSSSIARVAIETQFQKRRQLKKILPIRSDIQKLIKYLNNGMKTCYSSLKEKFSYNDWKNLAEFTLISVQLFNRRRAGEMERCYIEDFNNFETANEKTFGDSFKKMSEEQKKTALRYMRFIIRGKLGKTVSVLLTRDAFKYIKILLQYRQSAKVHPKNPYLFGVPGTLKGDYKYLRAYFILKKFSEECGASNPEALRGTNLRKHLATTCSSLNLTDDELTDLAAFMGHADKIHKEHYRQPVLSKEILQISKILEIVHGNDINDESDDSVDNQSGIEENVDDPPTKRVRRNTDSEWLENQAGSAEIIPKKAFPLDEDNFTYIAENLPMKKKRSTSPFGKCTRKRWGEKEKEIALKEFGHHIESRTLPSFKEILELKKKYPGYFTRNSATIKTWVNNQIKRRI